MKYRLLIVFIFLFMVLGVPLFAVSYTPYTPDITYTSSYVSSVSPTLATTPARLASTLDDEGDGAPGTPWGQPTTGNEPEDEGEDAPGQNWGQPTTGEPEDDPSPLGSPWPLLLFAVAYAAYGALRLRRRGLSTNEKTR